jgi:hypothetical protein
MDQLVRDRHLGSDDCICKSDSEAADWAKLIIDFAQNAPPLKSKCDNSQVLKPLRTR